MIRVDNEQSTSAARNLALEEFCVRHLDLEDDCLILYRNEPSVIIGRHQNPWQETDTLHAHRVGIPIIRRLSGGGTVYHDLGNLNFCHITAFDRRKFLNYGYFTRPLIDALANLGLQAHLNHDHAVEVRAKKVSGNAQFTNTSRICAHGTVLVDADLDQLQRILSSRLQIIAAKGTASIRARVGNVGQMRPQPLSVETVAQLLLDEYDRRFGPITTLRLTSSQWQQVAQIRREHYGSQRWNFGKTPPFTAVFESQTGRGRLQLDVRQGIIADVRLSGSDTAAQLERAQTLLRQPFDPDVLISRYGYRARRP